MNRMMEVCIETETVIRNREHREEQEAMDNHNNNSSEWNENTPLLKQRSSRDGDAPQSVVTFPSLREYGQQPRSEFGSETDAYPQPEWVENLRALMSNNPSSPLGAMIGLFFTSVLLISIVLLCVGTEPSIIENHNAALLIFWLNFLSIIVFTVEFTIDCIVYRGPWVCLMFEPAFIIDVLAIFPFYLEIIISLLTGTSVVSGATAVEGFAALRVLRLLRVVRLFKIFERSPQLRILSVALSKSYDGIMILAIVSPLLVCFFGTLTFYAEQTDEYYKDGVWYYTNGDRSPFQSITSCFWLSIVTLTTVGYGDVTPRTTLGRLVSAVASLAALVFLAFPLTVITTHYTNVLNDLEQEKKAEIRKQNAEDQARRDSITQQALFAFQEKAGRLSPGIPAVGPSSASPSVSSSPTRGSYISYKAQAAKLLDMARSDDVVTLRLAVNGEEGFRKVLQLLSEATASTSS